MHQFNVLIELFVFTEERTKTRLRQPEAEVSRFARRIALVARRKQARQLGDL